MAPQAPRYRYASGTAIVFLQRPLAHQGKEGPQSGSVGCEGIELDSGGKQCCLIKTLKALSLAFSRLSCSVSFLICSISISISRTGRQLRVAPKRRAVFNESDKNDRHRGSDEGDAPLLLETDAAAEDGDVVIGGKESDQAENQTATGLDGTEVIQAGPGALWCW
jgi:hypothetical protein